MQAAATTHASATDVLRVCSIPTAGKVGPEGFEEDEVFGWNWSQTGNSRECFSLVVRSQALTGFSASLLFFPTLIKTAAETNALITNDMQLRFTSELLVKDKIKSLALLASLSRFSVLKINALWCHRRLQHLFHCLLVAGFDLESPQSPSWHAGGPK